ncbi:MAG: D-alanyl-D-alanine carboxypeptidase [Thermoplasmata archaeon]
MILSYNVIDQHGNISSGDNTHILLPPASNMKILSTYFSYLNLGSEFKFRTKFEISKQSMKISGDPLFMFSEKNFKSILSNVEAPLANIHFKNDYLTRERYHPDWSLGDIDYCYGAQVTPFAINENCEPEAHVSVKSKPVSQIENYMKILKSEGNKSENIKNEEIKYYDIRLNSIIKHILQLSCNFSAELLMRFTASKINKKKVNWIDSASMVKKLFLSNGIMDKNSIVRDGSGLSRLNMINTLVLSKIGFFIFAQNSEFYDFFPSPGEGTLKNRLQDLKDYDIKAKTGTISYISSLTGISRTRNLFFSIIVYGIEDTQEREMIIDNMLEKILK